MATGWGREEGRNGTEGRGEAKKPKPAQRQKGLRIKSEVLDASFSALRRFGHPRAAPEWSILELRGRPLRWI